MKTGHLLAIFMAVVVVAVVASMVSRREGGAGQEQTAAQSPMAAQFDSGGLPVLTEYGTKLCPWCNELEKVLNGLAPKYEGTLVIRTVDLDKDRSEVEALLQLGFDGRVPFMTLRSGTGEVLWSQLGYLPEKDVVGVLAKYGIARQ